MITFKELGELDLKLIHEKDQVKRKELILLRNKLTRELIEQENSKTRIIKWQ